MRRRTMMQADELEEGMLVHHPDWADAPDRVAAIEEVVVGPTWVTITVAGTAKPFSVYATDYVGTVTA